MDMKMNDQGDGNDIVVGVVITHYAIITLWMGLYVITRETAGCLSADKIRSFSLDTFPPA